MTFGAEAPIDRSCQGSSRPPLDAGTLAASKGTTTSRAVPEAGPADSPSDTPTALAGGAEIETAHQMLPPVFDKLGRDEPERLMATQLVKGVTLQIPDGNAEWSMRATQLKLCHRFGGRS